jgi:hypothetical protein
LKEFYFLARLQQLAERTVAVADGGPNYDLLLWDAPSTGHFLSTLRSAKSFETYLTGPLASAGAEVARFFSNASRITVLPVTTLEEMAIDETIEMCGALQRDFHLQPAALLLNLVSPLIAASEQEVADLRQADAACSDPALHFAVARGLLERERAASLRGAVPAPCVAVRRVRQRSGDVDLLHEISQALEALPAGV